MYLAPSLQCLRRGLDQSRGVGPIAKVMPFLRLVVDNGLWNRTASVNGFLNIRGVVYGGDQPK